MNIEAVGRPDQDFGDFRNCFRWQAGVDFVLRVVFAVIVARPVIRQPAEVGDFGELPGFALLFLVFLLDGIG